MQQNTQTTKERVVASARARAEESAHRARCDAWFAAVVAAQEGLEEGDWQRVLSYMHAPHGDVYLSPWEIAQREAYYEGFARGHARGAAQRAADIAAGREIFLSGEAGRFPSTPFGQWQLGFSSGQGEGYQGTPLPGHS